MCVSIRRRTIRAVTLLLLGFMTYASLCALPACAAGPEPTSVPAVASGKGTISGRVVDASGAVLQGARIEMPLQGNAATSDAQGEFLFTGVPAGSYTITVSYVGFKTEQITATVQPGQTLRLTPTMQVGSKGEQVVVTAERVHGEAEAINRIRTSENILQVATSEVITSLPNANMADAIGRMPSVTLERDEGEGKYIQVRGTVPRWTNVTVNGVTVPSQEGGVRQIKLDAVPSDLVESVELNKTLSASQDADGIGGSVNFVTKRAGDTPTLSISTLGGFTPIEGGRPVDHFSATAGQRFGADKRFGFLVGGSSDFNGRGIDDVEPAWSVSNGAAAYTKLQTREYKYYRTRNGVAGGTDYKLGEFSGVRLDGMWSTFNDYGDKWYYAYNQGKAPTFYTSSRRPIYEMANLSLSGNHVLTSSWVNWRIAASQSNMQAAAGNPKFDFGWAPPAGSGLPTKINYTIGTANPYMPQFTATNIAQAALQNPANYNLIDGQTSTGNANGLNLEAGADYAKNYRLASRFSKFQFGFKVRNSHKYQNAIQAVYDTTGVANPNAAAYSMTNYLSTFTNNNYYGGNYNLGTVTNFSNITRNGLPLLNLNVGKTLVNSAANNYDLIERVTSGYLMNTIDLTNKLHLQTGLRFEATSNNTLGFLVKTATNGTVTGPFPSAADSTYLDVLPSMQLRYSLTKDSGIRAVFSRGLSRPDPLQLVPYIQETDSGASGTISVGNPNLKPEHSYNYDLLYEYYLKPLGMIQAGFFYKDVSRPIIALTSTVVAGQYPLNDYLGYTQTQQSNGTHARIDGLELGFQQRLSYLPGVLRGLGISANYSYTASGTTIPFTDTTTTPATIVYRATAMQRQAPHSVNVSPTFDSGRLSVRLGFQYNSAYIYQFANVDPRLTGVSGFLGPNGDDHVYAHTQLDVQGSFRFYRGMKLFMYGLNLNNEPFGHYTGSPQYMIQREYYRQTYGFGLKYDFGGEKSSKL